jgi:hypothetical protein
VTTETVLDDAGFSFDDLTDDTVTEEPSGSKLTGTRRSKSDAPAEPGTRRRRGPTQTRLKGLQQKLSSEMFQIGTLAGLPFPVTGYYVAQESDAFTRAIVDLASHRAEWIDALEHIADIQPGIVVGRTCIGIGAALAVDRGRAEPDSKFMQFVGVYSAWKAVEDKRVPGEDNGGTSSTFRAPPVRFTPVS